MSPGSLRSKLEDVTASEVTRLLSIRVRDGDSTRAALIANAVADELVAYSREEGALAPPAGELRIVERATATSEGIGPSGQLIVLLAAVAGLLGAFGLAVVVDGLSTVVRNEQELAALAPVAVLGSINGTRPRPGANRSWSRPIPTPKLRLHTASSPRRSSSRTATEGRKRPRPRRPRWPLGKQARPQPRRRPG